MIGTVQYSTRRGTASVAARYHVWKAAILPILSLRLRNLLFEADMTHHRSNRRSLRARYGYVILDLRRTHENHVATARRREVPAGFYDAL